MVNKESLWEDLETAVADNLDIKRVEKELWDKYGVTCAVLELDSTGFSRVTKEKGIVYYLSIIVRMRQLCGRIFQETGALSWRTRADNVTAEFPTVDAALEAAFTIHRRLVEDNVLLGPDDPYMACIGIGFGRCLDSGDEGMYGDEMNLASKLGEDTAKGGETLLTEAAFQNLKQKNDLEVEKRHQQVSGIDLTYYLASPRRGA